jgi:hypothetical protein
MRALTKAANLPARFFCGTKGELRGVNLRPSAATQGCQMVCFQTKNPNFGKFWRVLEWKMMVYFIDSWSILRSFVLVYGHWVQFVVIWYIFSRFGILCQEKSGNPAATARALLVSVCRQLSSTTSDDTKPPVDVDVDR